VNVCSSVSPVEKKIDHRVKKEPDDEQQAYLPKIDKMTEHPPDEPILHIRDPKLSNEFKAYILLSASKPGRDVGLLLSYLPPPGSDVVRIPLSLSVKFDAARDKARGQHGMTLVQYLGRKMAEENDANT